MTLKDRLPPLNESTWTLEQRKEAEKIISGPRGELIAPFQVLLRNPQLMNCTQQLGEYLRYSSTIGHRLTELTILITARYWHQTVEWQIHAPIAIEKGISLKDVEAINFNQQPNSLKYDEQVVYNFCMELQKTKKISDQCWSDAITLFGEKGVIDLIGIQGYYSFLAMVMNASQTSALNTDVKLQKLE